MAAPLLQHRYSAEEYLAYERQAEYKSEYLAGQIIAMSGVSYEHSLISMNLSRVLSNQTLDGPCAVHANDLRVKVRTRGMYTYPDIVVVYSEPQFEDAHVDTLLNPTLIIEVLSPSTEGYDRGAKFGYYRALPSLQEYLLIAQDQALVEHYVRSGDAWVLSVADDLSAVVPLPAIGCTLPLVEVYRRISFPPDPEAESLAASTGAANDEDSGTAAVGKS